MYKVLVLPSDETLAYLQALFQACPFHLDWDNLHVEVATTERSPKLSTTTYQARPGSMGSWYDHATGMSHLLLPLYPSPKFNARFMELGDVWGREFVPFMVIAPAVPQRRNIKAFINSVATALVDTSPLLTFDSEMVRECDDQVPGHQGAYMDFKSRGSMSNMLFLDVEDDEARD